MALAGNKQSNEVRFCWEQVLRTNPLFRISAAFAPADRARQLLPLYALFGAVEEICSEHSDEDLARRKLDWWRQECARLESHGSEHPVLRELLHSGAYEALRKDSLARLFENAETRLDPQTPADVDDLQAMCSRLSQPQFELELALSDMHQAMPQSLESIGAVSGLAQLLREAARRRPPADYWWLPLTLLARHGASRADISRDGKVDASARPVFADLLESCLGWIPAPEAGGAASEPEIAAARHLFVMSKLQFAALRRLQPSQPRKFATELNRVGLPQLYLAWKAARSIGTPAD
jgi:phytoene synthase